MNKLTERIISTAITLIGGYVGTKIVDYTWRKATGHDAPKDVDDTENNMWGAITFATISAGITALIRVTSQRGAKKASKAMAARSQAKKAKIGTGEV
ncbi:DUF4235 domain-containing protein [Citricoccus sp. GCM10030269]|uniref:DUF4235 domain-containing protein n=1 Tax=Citricoccus sp. GCM10030269 TaxID=3273388 RepID=UPI00361417CF